MPVDASSAPKVPPVIKRFVKQLVVTNKAVALYPESSTIPRENAVALLAILRGIFENHPDTRLAVTKDGLFHDGLPVFPNEATYVTFCKELYGRRLAEVRFHAGVTERDILAFLSLLKVPPEEIVAAGGVESRLWEMQVDGITVKESSVKIVESAAGPGDKAQRDAPPPGEAWPPDSKRIEELIVGAFGGRPRDQRVLVRVVEDPDLVSAYLHESLASRGGKPTDAWICGQLSSLSHAARSELPEDQPVLFRALADAVMQLDPDLRRTLIKEKLLTEARHDDGLADIVRQIDVEQICSVLVESLVDGEVSREGLARAIRNLALVSLSDREEVRQAAGRAMRAAGMSDEAVSSVLAGAAPSRIEVREREKPKDEEPLEKVLRLVDLAPSEKAFDAKGDPHIAALHAEARRGITDGDVTAALVTLVGIDPRPAQFATTMSMLEDTLGLLIERGDYEIAADVADGLAAAMSNERLSDEQLHRVSAALSSMALPKQMRSINKALRLFPKESWEYEACRRLLEVLGTHAIRPLLEVLAEESDMSARKSLVDVVAGLAPEHMSELSACLGDPRWYFVRNVVSILGMTRDPRILQYIERTIRYGDARVRRETIRAAAAVDDRRGDEILIAGLEDEDAQNVQLAARFLGSAGSRGAVGPLQRVARGEGRGNRDVSARIEAIEALGLLGATDALPTLQSIAARRTVFGGGRIREIRAAAEAAISAIATARAGRSDAV